MTSIRRNIASTLRPVLGLALIAMFSTPAQADELDGQFFFSDLQQVIGIHDCPMGPVPMMEGQEAHNFQQMDIYNVNAIVPETGEMPVQNIKPETKPEPMPEMTCGSSFGANVVKEI